MLCRSNSADLLKKSNIFSNEFDQLNKRTNGE